MADRAPASPRPRVTVVTAGHLSTCPRMLKAADAFAGAGWGVSVVSTLFSEAAVAADRGIHSTRGWAWTAVDYRRSSALVDWAASGFRYRAAQGLARSMAHPPPAVRNEAFARVHALLAAAIARRATDFIYAGTSGALAAAAQVARRQRVPFAVDFEDYHCAEHEATAEGRLRDRLARSVMLDVASDAAFVTGGSAAIADTCRQELGIPVLAINNVFPLEWQPSLVEAPPRPLRLYWFGQTMGRGRGLEDVVAAVAASGIRCELHIRTMGSDASVETLRRGIRDCGAAMELFLHSAVPPEQAVAACSGFDIGSSVDQGPVRNRTLNLSNKALTCLMAGLG